MKYADLNHWRHVAHENGLKLPRSDIKGFPARKLMSRYGVTLDEFKEAYGCSPTQWRRLNPDWEFVGFAGSLLEIIDDRATELALGPDDADQKRQVA